jgi:TRAP-type C4-dicarboxylate transport system substrate-binding protein
MLRFRQFATCAAVVAALALSVGASAANPIILKVAHFVPPSYTLHADVIAPWCDMLEKETKGQLKCQIYPALQLGGTPQQLVDQVKNGVADIVWTIPGYSAGRFPVVEALEQPFMAIDGTTSSRAAWAFAQKYAQKEFEPYKVLAVHTDGGAALHIGSKEVKTLADFKGLKLRAASRMLSKTITALGAVPVAMPISQVTESISKSVIDGAIASWEAVIPSKLSEVVKFHLDLPEGQPTFAAIVCTMLMNKQKYDSLPADMKALINRTTGLALSEAFGKSWDISIARNRKKVVADGAKLNVVAAAEYDTMRKATAGVSDEWAAEMTAKGYDGKALVAAAREVMTGRKP